MNAGDIRTGRFGAGNCSETLIDSFFTFWKAGNRS
jgi:hypothetical protein